MIAVPGIEPQTGNHHKDMSPACIDREPSAGAVLSVPTETSGRGRCFQATDRMENIGNRARAIISIIVECFMASSVPVRFTD
jgi:hypothetical protein